MQYLLLTIISCLSIITSCCDIECRKSYGLEFPIQVTYQKTFEVGDTIWLFMNIKDDLPDRQNGGRVDLSNFELFFEVSLNEVERTDSTYLNSSDFDLVSDVGLARTCEGTISDCINVYAAHVSDSLKFRVGIIPKFTGLYSGRFGLSSTYQRQEHEYCYRRDIQDEVCDEEIFAKEIEINWGATNYGMVKDYVGGGYDNYRHNGGFAFRVNP